MENLKNIIKEIQGYREELNLKSLSDDMILDCSVRILNTLAIETNRQGKRYTNPIDSPPINFIPASKEQVNFLIGLGYKEDTSKLSKSQANFIIKKLKRENGKGI